MKTSFNRFDNSQFLSHGNPTVGLEKYQTFCSACREVLTFFINIFVIIFFPTSFQTPERSSGNVHRNSCNRNKKTMDTLDVYAKEDVDGTYLVLD